MDLPRNENSERISPARRFKALGLILIGSSIAIYPPVMMVRSEQLGSMAYVILGLMLTEIAVGIGILVKGINLQKEEQRNG